MIRNAEITDLPALMRLGAELKAKTPYSGVEIDRERATQAYGQCLASALGYARVAVRDGELCGVLLGMADRLWWAKARYATDLLFYPDSAWTGIALLRDFTAWAWAVPGVVEITCGVSSGINVEGSGVMYRRTGFKQAGGLWMRVK